MNYQKTVSALANKTFAHTGRLSGIFILAMFLGGAETRQNLYEMTTELTQVSNGIEFRQWMIKSQLRLIHASEIKWKPLSVFPSEAMRFK